MPGIVDQHIDAPGVDDDLGDRGIDRVLGEHVELDGAEVDTMRLREGVDLRHLGRVPAGGLAHRGVDGVAGLGESLGGQAAEAAGGAGNENDFIHGEFLS